MTQKQHTKKEKKKKEETFPVTQLVKIPPAVQETLVWFLGQEDPLEKG